MSGEDGRRKELGGLVTEEVLEMGESVERAGGIWWLRMLGEYSGGCTMGDGDGHEGTGRKNQDTVTTEERRVVHVIQEEVEGPCEPNSSVLHESKRLGPQAAPLAEVVVCGLEDEAEGRMGSTGTRLNDDRFGGAAVMALRTMSCGRGCVIFDGECTMHGSNEELVNFNKFVAELLEEDVNETDSELPTMHADAMMKKSDVCMPAGGAGLSELDFASRASGEVDLVPWSVLSATGRLYKLSVNPSSRSHGASADPTSSAVTVASATGNGLQGLEMSMIVTRRDDVLDDEAEESTDLGSESTVAMGREKGGNGEGVDDEADQWLSCEKGIFRIAHDVVIPEHNTRLRTKIATEADITAEVSMSCVDEKGYFRYDGHTFASCETFKIYFVSMKANDRLFRGLALNLKADEKAGEWLGKLVQTLKEK